ncbi:histone-like nucleoid-structuring protein Lsr2 [Amycolatopsis magusensis]|uniref:histone-like nucleoid-structuring protein Lsr2 n=1 Tax=Amycolatopsis magusensis TaxID=882444 RepID=UPI003C2D2B47
MAQKVSVVMSDDIDGSPADETVHFGLDGVDYVIDLSAANADELRDALFRFVEVARRVSGRKKRGSPPMPNAGPAVGTSARRARAQAIRAWAREHGFEVSERGRVSIEVESAFVKATEAGQH